MQIRIDDAFKLWAVGLVITIGWVALLFWLITLYRLKMFKYRSTIIGTVIAIYLCICFCLGVFQIKIHERRRLVVSRYNAFAKLVNTGQVNDAYLYMNPKYRGENSVQIFADEFVLTFSRPIAGGLPLIAEDHGVTLTGSKAFIHFQKEGGVALVSGPIFQLEQIEGVWFINGFDWSSD